MFSFGLVTSALKKTNSRIMRNGFLLLFFLIFLSSLHAYEVSIEGVEDPEIHKLIQAVSKVDKLRDSPPATFNGLKRRANNDLPAIREVLHSFAYYDAKIEFDISKNQNLVTIKIDPGPVYPFAAFHIHYYQNGKEVSENILRKHISLCDLGITIRSPAFPESILTAQDTLLDLLNLQGFAFAKVEQREVFANQKEKNVVVMIKVDLGPLTRMGQTEIQGLERVKNTFFSKKIKWCEGALYDPIKIEKTQEALELSGLFRTVNITHAEEPVDGNLIPIKISVIEAKQRTVGFGLNFTTELGFGVTGEWEDRNVFGNGEKLRIQGNIWSALQDGRISYIIPDFKRQDQNLIWLLDGHHNHNKSYTETTFSFSGIIERKISDRLQISYGGMYKILRSMHSANNGIFDLIKIPLQLRWTNTDSLLDPTKGMTLQLRSTPSLQVRSPRFAYCINTFTGTHYQSLRKDHSVIFATKLTVGSIFGASNHDIPPPERFYAGSENTLRGYRFLTVSPLGRRDKPLGGRSLLIYTLELRAKIKNNFGLVFFYDIGNVYKDFFPDLQKGILQSTGLGIRYYTPIGPVRLDLAFPLNRRKKVGHRHGHIDSVIEAYFSIGQSF